MASERWHLQMQQTSARHQANAQTNAPAPTMPLGIPPADSASHDPFEYFRYEHRPRLRHWTKIAGNTVKQFHPTANPVSCKPSGCGAYCADSPELNDSRIRKMPHCDLDRTVQSEAQ